MKGGLPIWRHAGSTSQTRALRRADNDNDVVLEGMPHVSDGDLGDPFPGGSNNREITPYTTPSTNPDVYGNFTGVAVTDISNSDTIITADLWSDFPPAAPQNLIITNAGQNGQNVILAWDANTEPDLNHYAIYRGYQDSKTSPIYWNSSPSATTTNTTWTDPFVKINTSAPSFVHYRITAVDEANNESDYSNSVSTNRYEVPKISPEPIAGTTLTIPKKIALHQNYPNPFNPQTKIRIDLPREAHMVLKIYNVIGEKI